eukprot:jgi/Psemu1/288342/fgenesh1_pg.254_\
MKQIEVDRIDKTIASEFTDEDMAFDPAKISHVYHLGHIRPFGRSNNQLIAVLHAVDIALDNHGDAPNNGAVVAISRWAFKILEDTFSDGKNSTEFALALEQLHPVLIVHEDRLEALGLTEAHGTTQRYLSTKDAYFYIEQYQEKFTPQIIQRRRHLVLGQLLQHCVPERNLVLYNAVRDLVDKRWSIYGNSENKGYVTVHSRWLEGECYKRIGEFLEKDECWMTPSYIKDIMGGSIDRPIVFIGDGQKEEVLRNLKNDPDIGPALIVPEEDVVLTDGADFRSLPQPWNDMMIAVMGEMFIGTRASTFATMTGTMRVMRGADPSSNFIYTTRYTSKGLDSLAAGEKQTDAIEICEDCLFFCDGKQSNICGHEVVFT